MNPRLNKWRAWAQANMPKRETFENIRWLRPIAHRILAPELWRFTRRSVPRGVALGMLVGVLIPVAQTLFAAFFALPVRANVPVAALTTFVTNPLTTPPIWVAAYWVGSWLLNFEAVERGGKALTAGVEPETVGWAQWLLSTAAPATMLGLVVLSITFAVLGYVVAAFGWRWWIAHKWNQRAMLRNLRGD